MHLERVTSRSSEAGLAGWIASNDVTLFTMVLIMAVALFLHSRLTKGTRENRALTAENASINATLSATAHELDSARDLLDKTKETLHLTQEERDALQQQLVEKLSALAELNDKLEAMLASNGELETQRQTLLASQRSLSQEKAALQSDSATLRDRLDALSQQLAAKLEALKDLESQRDRLKSQAEELDAIVATLKQRLREMNIDLVAARDEAEAQRAVSDKRAEELAAKVKAGDKQAEDYLAQLRKAATLLDSLQVQNLKLVDNLSEAERKRQSELAAQAEHNRALVGLKGPCRRVAILFDASGSMRQPGVGGSDRWKEAQDIASVWLEHISVEKCVLIVFSSDVRTFPADGSLEDLEGANGGARRAELMKELKAITPGGWTNTYDALAKAYQYDVDTVLLFSDGAPSKVASGAYDDALARQIYDLCRAHAAVPVNTIGMGNYFDREMSTFLRTVAQITGGAFRGE